MKKYLILFAMLVSIVLVSCDHNNDPVQVLPEEGVTLTYEFGACDKDGNFTGEIKEYQMVYGSETIIDGTPCKMISWRENGIQALEMALSTDGYHKLYSFAYYPFIDTSYGGCFTHFGKGWRNMYCWNSWNQLDTANEYPIPYSFENEFGEVININRLLIRTSNVTGKPLRNKKFTTYNSEITTKGSEINYKRILRVNDSLPDKYLNHNKLNPKYYFENNRVELSDDIYLKFYTTPQNGIIAVFIEHNSPEIESLYCYKLKGYQIVN